MRTHPQDMLEKALNQIVSKRLTVSDVEDILTVPEVLAVIEQLVDYQNPLRANIPRRPGSGQSVRVIRRTAGSTPMVFVADTDDITEDTSTRVAATFPYMTIATQGKVTRKAIAEGRQLKDILREEIEDKSLDYRDKEDWAYFKGKSTITGRSPSVSAAKEFGGLDYFYELSTASTSRTWSNNVIMQTTASGGTSISLAKLDEVIDACTGDPNLLVMSKKMRRLVSAALQSQQRFNDRVEIAGGFKVMSYNGIPILTSTNIENTWTFDGDKVSAYTGDTTTGIYVLDTTTLYMSVLTEITVVPLAIKSSQYREFDIICDEVLVLKNPQKCAILIGIDTA